MHCLGIVPLLRSKTIEPTKAKGADLDWPGKNIGEGEDGFSVFQHVLGKEKPTIENDEKNR